MYNEFYGFTKDPFLIVPDPNYLYMSPKHEEALARIAYGIKERRAIMLLTGEVGAGKTTLIRYLVAHLPASIQAAMIANSNLQAEALLRMIMAEFMLPTLQTTDKAALIKDLQAHLLGLAAKNKRGLLIIDEAQNLPLDALEEIRMLNNLQVQSNCLIQIILVGQPELRTRMKDPRYLQIAQRIAFNYHIEALSHEETRSYIQYRLKRSGGNHELFTDDAVEMVYRLSGGIPRTINLVCDSALIYGFTEELRVIDSTMVTRAAKQLDLMGLVNANNCRVSSAPYQAQGGNGGGKTVEKGLEGLENSLASFVAELKERTETIVEQTSSVTSTAIRLSAILEKMLAQDRASYERLCTDSAKLSFLRRLLDEELKK